MVNIFNYFKDFKNLLLKNDSRILLGRWCHKGVPKCDDKVIERKIDFALLDNNLCNLNEMREKYTKIKI